MGVDSIIAGGIENRKRKIAALVRQLDVAVTLEDWDRVKELRDTLGEQIDVLFTLQIGTKVPK